jgi:hypothetical protein
LSPPLTERGIFAGNYAWNFAAASVGRPMLRPRASRHHASWMAAGERGQVAVEAALVLPLMVFLTLGIVQLSVIAQARLMTEYAAFQAARAGIVWGGNLERMHDAAVFALLPTMGRTDDFEALGATFERHLRDDAMLAKLHWPSPKTFNGVRLTGQVRVDIVSPSGTFGGWKAHGPEELDFDGVADFPEAGALEAHVAKLYDPSRPDAEEDALREQTVLRLRLRYWLELRIPFASQALFLAWFAANAGVELHGGVDRSSTRQQNALGKSGEVAGLRDSAGGLTGVSPAELAVLWDLARDQRRFFLPLTAAHSMRMQSAFHAKWVMHR